MKVRTTNALMKYLREKHNISIEGTKDKKNLRNIGYYHGYKGYRYINNPQNRINLSSFDEIVSIVDFDSKLKNFVSNNGIVQFYCFDNYVYIRNFSDYGAIGKIESNQVKTLLDLPNLRIAYNGKNTQDNYYGFFLRSGKDFYLLDVYTDTLYQTNLELSQDESIRNAISDGNDICISIMNERDTETFTTKNTIIVDFDKLKKSISVLTS